MTGKIYIMLVHCQLYDLQDITNVLNKALLRHGDAPFEKNVQQITYVWDSNGGKTQGKDNGISREVSFEQAATTALPTLSWTPFSFREMQQILRQTHQKYDPTTRSHQ